MAERGHQVSKPLSDMPPSTQEAAIPLQGRMREDFRRRPRRLEEVFFDGKRRYRLILNHRQEWRVVELPWLPATKPGPHHGRAAEPLTQLTGGPRSRGQRPWGSRNRYGGRPRVNVAGPRATNSGGGIPQGQYLSKTPSPLTNDPLPEKAYFPGLSEDFRAIATREKIYPTCTYLPELLEQSYTKVASISPSFGKTVPRSAYDYYISVIVAYRLLLLHQQAGGKLT
uniref:Uncharacterized protein n=1 Tax=Glossina pallidipes TaxID=7398 RepID=A0A1B0A568_GLOPL